MTLVASLTAACATNTTTTAVRIPTQESMVPNATASVQMDGQVNPTSTKEPTDIPVQTPDTGWSFLRNGLERRIINLRNEEGVYRENLYLLRVDPGYFHFDVAYQPGTAKRLTEWQIDTEALIVINAGYFTEANKATGLIIVDGQASGATYEGYGGMLAIAQNMAELRWLQQTPYDPAEPLTAAVQSFPILIKPGGLMGYLEEDGLSARRTVIGQDSQGRIVFILATTGTMTLHEMSQFLANSGLELEIALNLDGGSSTGLLLADPVEGVPPFTQLPAVITVHANGD